MVDLICPDPSQINNRDLIVNDRGTGRVQKFDLDGNFILKFGSVGNDPEQFGIAEHMAMEFVKQYLC